MNSRNRKLGALLLAFFVSTAGATPLFDDEAVLEVSISGPFGALLESETADTELPFRLHAAGIEHPVELRVRGKSRREVCSFPPLRLNFPDNLPDGSPFVGQDKLKLVTHCQSRKSSAANVLEEYAAYRIFNELSDFSYRVRLARITYVDSTQQAETGPQEQYGFLIEPETELAARAGGTPLDIAAVSLSSLDNRQAALVYIFQYMIGNTDWSLVTADLDDACCHNMDLFDTDTNTVLVPFDFDLSGLVNTRYARPDPSLRISRVRQRLYRGYCMPADALSLALGHINSRREAVLGVFDEIPGLPDDDARKATKYIEDFFKRASNEDRLLGNFERRCL